MSDSNEARARTEFPLPRTNGVAIGLYSASSLFLLVVPVPYSSLVFMTKTFEGFVWYEGSLHVVVIDCDLCGRVETGAGLMEPLCGWPWTALQTELMCAFIVMCWANVTPRWRGISLPSMVTEAFRRRRPFWT